MGFKKSQFIGKTAEKYIQEMLNKHGFHCIFSDVKEYDLLLNYQLKQFKIEVKYDMMASRTGNLALEFYNHKKCKPSGINATHADFWVYVIPEEFYKTAYIIKTNELLNFFQKKPGRTVFGGDKNSTMSLYKLDDILPIFTRLDTLNKEEIITFLEK